jgi:DNA-binding CsgD family transcriptional regulator
MTGWLFPLPFVNWRRIRRPIGRVLGNFGRRRPESASPAVVAPLDTISDLSAQTRKLLELIGEGLTNRQMSERMFLAEKTVKNYVSRPLPKLGIPPHTTIRSTDTGPCRRLGEVTAAGWINRPSRRPASGGRPVPGRGR